MRWPVRRLRNGVKGVVWFLAVGEILSGCAVKYPVVGKFDRYAEVFRGRVEARTLTGQGHIEAEGEVTKVKCVGTSNISYAPPGQRGRVVLECQDGRRVSANYTVTGWAKGYGAGMDQYGNRFTFTFGMSDAEAEEVIKKQRPPS